jgi:hypothetical protein
MLSAEVTQHRAVRFLSARELGVRHVTAAKDDEFPIKRAMDPDGDGIVDVKDSGCFLQTRAGDHFMCQFQCDLCHFRNTQNRHAVVGSVKDSLSLSCICLGNLDAMWAKEPTTVAGNLREVKKILEKGSVLDYALESLLVPAGPFRLRDDQQMSVASTLMLRSLDTGKNEPCVQYDTVCGPMRGALSNQWRASLDGQTALVMMQGTKRLIKSTWCPTNGEWFERFMLGYHKRVGDVSRPDLAISIEVMVALMVRFEGL